MDRLKSVGVARTAELPNIWLPSHDHICSYIGYPRRPSVEIGDALFYYASGKGVVFAVAIVTSDPFDGSTMAGASGFRGFNARFPWLTYVSMKRLIPDLRDGIPLDYMNILGERDLRQSIQRQSQIRISPAEASAAMYYLGHV